MQLLGFYVLACAVTWTCWLSILAEKCGWLDLRGTTDLLATVGQFGPFVAAAVWISVERGSDGILDLLRRMVQVRVSPACLMVAVGLPPTLFFAAIWINVWLGKQTAPPLSFPEPVGTAIHFLINLAIGGALGEEPGWRGFALPRLRARFSVLVASLLLAFAWTCWHLPLWWIADVPASFPVYVLGMISLTILFTWLDEWGQGSIFVALVFHASLNSSLIRLPVFPAIAVVYLLFWAVAIPIVVARGRAWTKWPATK